MGCWHDRGESGHFCARWVAERLRRVVMSTIKGGFHFSFSSMWRSSAMDLLRGF